MNGSKTELTCYLYEHLLEVLGKFLENPTKSLLKQARETITLLIVGVDTTIPLGQDLVTLYIYINSLVLKATTDSLNEAIKLTHILLDAYKKVKQEDTPILHTKVSLGLTYGYGGIATEVTQNRTDYTI